MTYQQNILAWYAKNKRELPWRATTNSWHIIVSEIMLQQTQVNHVLPKYLVFLKAFPTAAACAQASPTQILMHWQGLGYNSRALRLHQLAKNFPNPLPTTEQELQQLPGIGPYTAGAILAFIHNKDVLVNDTNIQRVLSRINGKHLTNDEIFAELPKGQARNWYNALMDLGALVCKSKPKCEICPVQQHCKNPTLTIFKATTERYEGSWRMYRGKVLTALLAEKNMSTSKLSKKLLLDKKTIKALLQELEQEGFLEMNNNKIMIKK